MKFKKKFKKFLTHPPIEQAKTTVQNNRIHKACFRSPKKRIPLIVFKSCLSDDILRRYENFEWKVMEMHAEMHLKAGK